MSLFTRPELLLLALPWLAVWAWFARHQRRSCAWIWSRVHERFRERFTLERPATLRRRLALLLVLGLLLIVAAAGPAVRGETEVRELGCRLVLLLDGSASMLATDLGSDEESRFERGRRIARELGRRLEGSRFALVVFSGVSALQLPMTADPAAVEEALTAASFHTFYESSGSSFGAALDAVLHFVEPGRADLQAVLLSDGEQPFADSFEEPLAALAERRVPVHGVAIGSVEGQGRRIFDFRDVVAGEEEPRVLREFSTRRVDRHLRRIARRTGGIFTLGDENASGELAAAIRRRIERAETVRTEGRRDLSGIPLALFLVGFLGEALLWGRRRRRGPDGFDLDRLGGGRPASAAGVALLLALALAAGACRDDSPLARASRENERGIAADALEAWPQARVHYDRARAYELRPEIPAFNLARSVTLQEDWSEAHDLYQRALELSPELAVGHYNDGHVLYRWGEAELDLERCELERTLELWKGARRRFAGAAERFPEDGAGRELARRNLRFVGERIDEVTEACSPPPPAGGGAGEGENGSAGGGGGEDGEAGGEGSAGEDDGQAGGGAGEEEAEGGGGGGEGEAEGGGGGGEGEAEGGGGGGEGEAEGGGGGGEGEAEGGGEEGEEEDESGGEEGEEEGESGGEEGEEEGESGGGEGEPEGQGSGDGEGQGDGEGGGGAGAAGGGEPLTGEELEQVRQALARIQEGRFADGRYHYKSLPEQFPRATWQNPDPEIWW